MYIIFCQVPLFMVMAAMAMAGERAAMDGVMVMVITVPAIKREKINEGQNGQ